MGAACRNRPCEEKVRGAGQEGGFPLFTVILLCVNGTSTVLCQAHLPNTPPRAKGRGVSEAVFPAEVEFDYTTHTSSQA